MAQEKLRILIADDDEGDRRLIKRALERACIPCECTETRSVKEALEACETLAFDCAIVDYQLPGQDGLAGVSNLHDKAPYMAIIMSTGQGDETIATEAMKRGASDYIPKTHISSQSICRATLNAVEKMTLQKRVADQRKELENFSRVLVHDLKTPIQSVGGFAALIEQMIQEGNPQEVAVYCGRVVRGIKRMGKLIDTLYDYTRVDEHVVFEPTEMNQVMNDTLSTLAHVITEGRACVTHDDLPTVYGNAPQLTQLLQNLIGNSIKYCKAEVPAVRVAATADEGKGWLFSVKDNGIGIPERHRREVFEPFKRLQGTSEYEGTGLGLATCKKIVERHNGSIWCESKDGQGTTFFFTIGGEESHR